MNRFLDFGFGLGGCDISLESHIREERRNGFAIKPFGSDDINGDGFGIGEDGSFSNGDSCCFFSRDFYPVVLSSWRQQ